MTQLVLNVLPITYFSCLHAPNIYSTRTSNQRLRPHTILFRTRMAQIESNTNKHFKRKNQPRKQMFTATRHTLKLFQVQLKEIHLDRTSSPPNHLGATPCDNCLRAERDTSCTVSSTTNILNIERIALKPFDNPPPRVNELWRVCVVASWNYNFLRRHIRISQTGPRRDLLTFNDAGVGRCR